MIWSKLSRSDNICVNGRIRCPTFSIPPPAYSAPESSDDDERQSKTVERPQMLWNKLTQYVLDQRQDIPLRTIAVKAKLEASLHDQM